MGEAGPLIECPHCGSQVPLADWRGAPGDNVWRCPDGHAFGPRVERELERTGA